MKKVTNEYKHKRSHEMERKDAEPREPALHDAMSDTTNADAGWNPYVSMYSVILTALQLSELYDNKPGKEVRMMRLDELAKEFNRLIFLPRK
jgi:hypothetical protein